MAINKITKGGKVNKTKFTLIISLFIILFTNKSFWMEIVKIYNNSQQNIFFIISIFFFLLIFINLCLTLISFKYIFKPLVIFILLSASLAAYFMNSYGIMIDREMIRNVMETDINEAKALFNPAILLYLLFLGIIPSIFVYRQRLEEKPFIKELLTKLVATVISLLLITAILFPFYKDYLSLGKNYKYIRHLINPVNYIYAISSYTKRSLTDKNIPLKPLGTDAVLLTDVHQRKKKNLLIIVVGEAARAVNFSLNGYREKTNPLLSKEKIFNFNNTYSCGTATAASVPCMFSHYNRDNYSRSKADHYENLLDVLTHAGIKVLWRDNNSGCKGVCERVETENMEHLHIPALCGSEECFDMVLLNNLQDYVDSLDSDALIVLHQKGSHGPGYFLRHPPQFSTFSPECTTNQLQECTQDEVTNAYNDTLLYTDYFLTQVISFLKDNSDKFNTAMMYMSDHGESLGENNIYLHGLPYFIAPDEQKHIPFIVWLSPDYISFIGLDETNMKKQHGTKFSHDNLFHSVLGLMGVKTNVYDRNLDVFARCRTSRQNITPGNLP